MFELSEKNQAFIRKELSRYETKRSAIIPALYKVQEEKGWVSPEAVLYLSNFMELPTVWIEEVLHFYTLFNKKPVGKKHVQVCCNVSCSMAGGRELMEALCEHFKVTEGAQTADGEYTFSRVECLGSCGSGPMMQVNDEYFENLTLESALSFIKEK